MNKKPRIVEEDEADVTASMGSGLQLPDGLEARMVAQLRLRESHVPQKYMGKSLDSFRAPDKKRKELVEAARNYVKSFNLNDKTRYFGLFFQACTGAGKTHLATAILKEVIAKGYSGVYCNVPQLLETLRDLMFNRAHYDDAGFLARCESAELLVLDDIGTETVTGWVQDRLYLLVNRRYEDMSRTIVTTNCKDDELRERLGERVASRLIEMCDYPFDFPDEDYRMKMWIRKERQRQR